MKKLLALAVAIILALGCMSAFAVSGPIEGVDYPELPDGTLKITVTGVSLPARSVTVAIAV